MNTLSLQRKATLYANAGLVFLAFALNLVDCGGLLGGRLGDAKQRERRSKPQRTYTM